MLLTMTGKSEELQLHSLVGFSPFPWLPLPPSSAGPSWRLENELFFLTPATTSKRREEERVTGKKKRKKKKKQRKKRKRRRKRRRR